MQISASSGKSAKQFTDCFISIKQGGMSMNIIFITGNGGKEVLAA